MIMAGSGSDPPGFRLDIKQILSEAQHRWLRPAEICEILQNYRNFHITPEAPYRPVSGSVFLFDRKVLRYFRKDGHNWRKKKDGKTVKEAHEKLKVGSIDVLHCYYAHGEEDDNFQRRSYWMLEQDLMHIVFVHYLEVKGNKANVSSNRSIESAHSNYVKEYSLSDTFHGSHKKLASLKADSASLASTVTSAYEEAESEDSHQVCSRFHSYPELASGMDSHLVENRDTISKSYGSPLSSVEYPSLPGIDGGGKCDLGNSASGPQRTNDLGFRAPVFERCSNGEVVSTHDFKNNMPVHGNWQYSLEGSPLQFLGQTVNQDLIADSCYDLLNGFHSENLSSNQYTVRGQSYLYPDEQDEQQTELNFQNLNSPMEVQADISQENFMDMLGLGDYSTIKQPRLGSVKLEEGLNKSDSFSRWVAKELEDVEELHMQSTDRLSWNVIDIEDDCSCLPSQLHVDSDSLVPSLSQEQLFSIIDFSPNWAYSSLETKVLITGRFLKSDCKVVECKWSCMFGEVEVPAEVLADGVLRCHAPPHKPGVLPFYVTCSNRLACSEVREFEYRLGPSREFGASNVSAIEMHLLERFESVMSLEPVSSCYSSDSPEAAPEKHSTVNKIICMMEEDMADRPSDFDMSQSKVKEDLFLERKLRQNFYVWLVHQVTADGKGRTVLDDEGQGVLHLAAALGYDWALRPILASGVSVDFRDMNGWTALHWAAFYGREKTVVGLVSLGASPGALTDPSAEFPLGRTPADLASANRHKGISGFLAESSLTSHLSKLTVTDAKEELASEVLGAKVGETVTERVAVTSTGDDVPDVLSLKDSLAAIRNATQAAARIHQIFRVQSFQRKQIIENNDNELSSDEHALSVVASRTCKLAQNNGIAHAAAIQIQKKFRGWNRRKEFLLVRQRIVKIQAHVRGHQVRKKYKPIIWSVGILEKVILRWRRKGSGLRGFRSEAVMNKPSTEDDSVPEDDYDFLKEGRKQTEVRMQKALARVKSMTQYPEARAQYRRLLTAAEGLRETKEDGPTQVLENQKDASYAEEDLFDVDNLLDEDTFMSIAFD